MKKIAMAVILSSFIAAPALAAGGYVGIGAGTNQMDYSTVGSSIAYGVLGGYSFNDYVAAEVSYSSLGDADITGSTNKVSGSVAGIAAVGSLPLSKAFSLMAKVGYSSSSMSSGGLSANRADVSYGVGAQFNASKSVGVRLNYDAFNVGDDTTFTKKGSAMMTLGVVFMM